MNEILDVRKIFVDQGYVYVSSDNYQYEVDLTSGVAFFLYDKINRKSGVCHFEKVYSFNATPTPIYSYPAILVLYKMLIDEGAKIENISAHVAFGKNIKVELMNDVFEICKKKKLLIESQMYGVEDISKVYFDTNKGAMKFAWA